MSDYKLVPLPLPNQSPYICNNLGDPAGYQIEIAIFFGRGLLGEFFFFTVVIGFVLKGNEKMLVQNIQMTCYT